MAKNLYIDAYCGSVIGAMADDDKLLEFSLDKKNNTITIGSVFKGRVEAVLNGMQAAFVNVGLNRNGYLSASDMLMDKSEICDETAIPQTLNINVGDNVLVQVVKDATSTKGVRLTTNLSFAGRFLVYMPTINIVAVSRKIVNEKTRDNLLSIGNELLSLNYGGFILRTASEFASKKDLVNEAKFLIGEYKHILKSFNDSGIGCIHEEGNLPYRMFRDLFTPDINKFIVNSKETYDYLVDLGKKRKIAIKSKLVLHDSKVDMFKTYGIDKEVQKLLDNRVELSNGGYLIIDKTEALTVIDVNTGSFVGNYNFEETVFRTNLCAVMEIARQLILRNISGIIVIDFIDMQDEEHRQQIELAMKNAVLHDKAKCNVLGMTGLGLIEMTRKKKRKPSNSLLKKDCPYCKGTGQIESNDYICMKIRVALLDVFAEGYDTAIIDLNVDIWDYVVKKNQLKSDVEKIWTDKKIYVIPHKTYHQEFFLVKGIKEDEIEQFERATLL